MKSSEEESGSSCHRRAQKIGKEHVQFMKFFLHGATSRQQRAIINDLSGIQLRLVSGLSLNLLSGNIPMLGEGIKDRLIRHRSTYEMLADRRTAASEKRKKLRATKTASPAVKLLFSVAIKGLKL